MVSDLNQELLDKIAVIGMAGRFPGANGLEKYWENLCNGVNSISTFSKEDLISAGVSPSIFEKNNFVNSKGIIDDVDLFDINFFDMNPKEATLLDPQHRIYLECAWQAIETAGYNPESFPGRIGVYAGVDTNTYMINNLLPNKKIVTSSSEVEHLLSDKDYLTSRISYKLNLKGPSFSVQSACSSSMVAIHLASESLISGESDMALAGGVSITFPIKSGYYHEDGGIVSPEGICRAFDKEANGTIYGNGVGTVVLKRYEDALRDRDTIYGVIMGTAVNNDGALKVGYTAPGVEGQASVIKEALNVAGVSCDSISYIETHGTGTKLGDTIEFAALKKAFAGTAKKKYCAIGSVKTNVGHLSTAAGIASFIKTVLSLKNKKIVPSLNYKESSETIDFDNSPFYVNTRLQDWVTDGSPRRAGVSSFGLGGTNVHIVLQEAPEVLQEWKGGGEELIFLSSKTESALENMSSNLKSYLKKNPEISLRNIAYTLQEGRKHFKYRKYFTCKTKEEMIQRLSDNKAGKVFHICCEDNTKQVVFMFSGYGEQYDNMALQLYQENESYRTIFHENIKIMYEITGSDYLSYLYPNGTEGLEIPQNKENGFKELLHGLANTNSNHMLNKPSIIYPLLFAVEYAIAKLLMEMGIKPVAMIGHSIGEYTAACISGVLSVRDAITLLYKRGVLIETLPQGNMLTVMLGEEELGAYIKDKLSLSASNTHNTCGVSGDIEAIDKLQEQLLKNNIACKKVETEYAFHSYMMDAISEKFLSEVKKVKLNLPQIPYLSNVTGTWTDKEVTDPKYWVKHLSYTVKFYEGFRTMVERVKGVIIQVGPGNMLSSFAMQIMSSKETVRYTVQTMNADNQKDLSYSSFLKALGKLWGIGIKIKWEKLGCGNKGYRIPLPTYPFERKSYYITPNNTSDTDYSLTDIREDGNLYYIQKGFKQKIISGGLYQKGETHCWLVFTDASSYSEEFIQFLQTHGQDIITVSTKDSSANKKHADYKINMDNVEEYISVIQELIKEGKKLDYIVDITELEEKSDETLFKMGNKVKNVFNLLKAAQLTGIGGECRLVAVTAENFDVIGKENNARGIHISDLTDIIAQEMSHHDYHTVDVHLAEKSFEKLTAAIVEEYEEREIIIRNNRFWVQEYFQSKLCKSKSKSKKKKSDTDEGIYLIICEAGRKEAAIADSITSSVILELADTQTVEKGNTLEHINYLEIPILKDHELIKAVKAIRIKYNNILGVYYMPNYNQSIRPIHKIQLDELEEKLYSRFCRLNLINEVISVSEAKLVVVDLPLDYEIAFMGKAENIMEQQMILDFVIKASKGVGQSNWKILNWQTEKNNDKHEEIFDFFIKPQYRNLVMEQFFASDLTVVGVLPFDITKITQPFYKNFALYHMNILPLYERPELETKYVSSRNKMDELILEIWERTLGIKKIGMKDNFFELGGNSLLALQILFRINQKLNIEIPMSEFILNPFIEYLSDYTNSVNWIRDEKIQTVEDAQDIVTYTF